MSKFRKTSNQTRNQSTHSKSGGGPKTEAGKARSSLNALRHGYTSHKAILLCNENEQDLRDFSQIFFNRFQPVNEAEGLLVEELTAAAWRLRRLWHAESAVFDMEMCRISNNPEDTCDLEPVDELMRFARALERLSFKPGNPLMLIQRYARSLRIQYNRALRELRELQAERNDNNPLLPNEPGTQPGAANIPPTATQPTDQEPLIPTDPPAPRHPMRPARRVLVYRPDPHKPATVLSNAM